MHSCASGYLTLGTDTLDLFSLFWWLRQWWVSKKKQRASPSAPRFMAKPDPSSTLPEVDARACATAQGETSWWDLSGLSLEAENYEAWRWLGTQELSRLRDVLTEKLNEPSSRNQSPGKLSPSSCMRSPLAILLALCEPGSTPAWLADVPGTASSVPGCAPHQSPLRETGGRKTQKHAQRRSVRFERCFQRTALRANFGLNRLAAGYASSAAARKRHRGISKFAFLRLWLDHRLDMASEFMSLT